MSYQSSDLLSYYRTKFNELNILKRKRSKIVGGYLLLTWIMIMAVIISDEFIPALYAGAIVYGLLTYVFVKAYIMVNKDIRQIESEVNIPNPFL